MSVVAEIPALKFKLDAHALPPFGSDLAHGFTVGESSLDSLDHVPQLFRQHSEQQHDALLVHRLMTQPAEVTRVAIDRSIFYRLVVAVSRWRSMNSICISPA